MRREVGRLEGWEVWRLGGLGEWLKLERDGVWADFNESYRVVGGWRRNLDFGGWEVDYFED